jgi:plastocyanin
MRLAPLPLTKPGRGFPAAARRRRIGPAELLVAAMLFAAASAFAASLHVAQKHRSFSPSDITIQRGDTIAFSNDDEFLHQIYVESKAMSFDSAEQYPGETINVTFAQPGTFQVRCHIHPKMLLTVHVK